MKTQNAFLVVALSVLAVACSSGHSSPSAADPDPFVEKYGVQPDISIPAVPSKLLFEDGVKTDRLSALKESVSVVHTIEFDKTSALSQEMMKMMKLTDLQPTSLQAWLEDRVHYVVDDNYDLEGRATFDAQAVQYPDPDSIPDAVRDQAAPISNDDSKAQVAMSNIGAGTYYYGKRHKTLVKLDLGQIGIIGMKSPRTGLLKIGPGLFPDLGGHHFQNVMLAVYRAGILFHEARHSDGHAKSLGFLHPKCITGDYAGLPACDGAANGPYTVGANMMKNLMQSCKDRCSELTMKVLQNIYFDQADRKLNSWDVPNASAETKPGMDWDDAPESIVGAH